MAITLVSYGDGTGTTASATSSAIDTTGANLLIAVVSGFNAEIDESVFSDNKSNTFFVISHTIGTSSGKVFGCFNPTVGTGHTVSYSKSSSYPQVGLYAFSGVDAPNFVFSRNDSATAASSVTVGSVEATKNNSLFFLSVTSGNPYTLSSVTGGFTTLTNVGGIAASYMGLHTAYKIQSAAGAENPTATMSGSMHLAATMSTFLESTSGGGGAVLHPLRSN